MDLEFKSFDERIEELRQENVKMCKFHSNVQKFIDEVRFKLWLRNNENISATCRVWPTYRDIDFHFSNTPVDEFIENILGPLHRRFGILWKLELHGDLNDPCFTFKPTYKTSPEGYYPTLAVKEGEFKLCKVEEIVVEPDKVEFKEVKTDGKKELRLICE